MDYLFDLNLLIKTSTSTESACVSKIYFNEKNQYKKKRKW